MPPHSNRPRSRLPYDFLTRLGLEKGCSTEEVREAFLRKAQEVHPDHGGNKAAFQQLKADYEQALQYAQAAGRRCSAKPHDATIQVRPGTVKHGERSLLLRSLLVAAGGSLLGCALAQSSFVFVSSLVSLSAITLLLALLALPRIGRANATIVFFATLLLSGTLMIGFTVQGEYSLVYQMRTADMDAYDWLMASSPFYFFLLWIAAFCGWSASLTKRG